MRIRQTIFICYFGGYRIRVRVYIGAPKITLDDFGPVCIRTPIRVCVNVALENLIPYPANGRRLANVGLLLGQRRRRWPNSKPTLAQRLMFSG